MDLYQELATAVFVVIGLIVIAALMFRIREALEAEKLERQAQLVRSVRAHPAGKGRDKPTGVYFQDNARHIDKPGYDWVNGDL